MEASTFIESLQKLLPGLLLDASSSRGTVSQPLCLGEQFLPQPDIRRSYLNQFVPIDKINSLLQAQLHSRSQLYANVGRRGAYIGFLLFLAHVDGYVLRP
jgi:hypothetical protein